MIFELVMTRNISTSLWSIAIMGLLKKWSIKVTLWVRFKHWMFWSSSVMATNTWSVILKSTLYIEI